jgi:hypothetical protein
MAAMMAAFSPFFSSTAVITQMLLDKKSATLFGWSGVPSGVQHAWL